MRCLLVNPWIYDFACYDLFSKPIGFLQIAALLKSLGFKVELIDCLDRLHPKLAGFLRQARIKSSIYGSGSYYYEIVKNPNVFNGIPRHYKRYGMPQALFKRLLNKTKIPDIILVTSGMTYWYKGAFEAIEILKKNFPRVPLVLGGIYATLCYKHALKFSGADFVFKGSDFGEIIKLISEILNKNLYFKCARKYILPAYEFYPRLEYVSLRTSSGCPYKCSYCGWYLLNPRFSQRDATGVVNEIEYFSRKLRIKNIAFYDDALFYNPGNHIIKILKLVFKKKISVNFHTPNGLHARFLDQELAVLLKKCGFIQPRLGLESVNVTRQKKSGRKVDNQELIRAVEFLKGAGYNPSKIGIYLLMGLPGQTKEEIKESIFFAHQLKVRVYLEEYSPVPGTPDYKLSGLNEDADPLLHNNSTFPLYNSERFFEFHKLKDLNHRLNQEILR